MLHLHKFFFPLILCIPCLVSPVYAESPAEAGASVPEPSVAILGGVCGMLLLIWRRKS